MIQNEKYNENRNERQNILSYEEDCWQGNNPRNLKIAFNEFLIQLVSFLPRGLKHNSCFNKIRTFVIKTTGVKIGLRSYFYPGTIIVNPNNISIGQDTFFNYNCLLSAFSKISIGNRVSVSYNVKIITETHDAFDKNFKAITKPIVIKDNVWLGAGSIILPGVTIGEGSVIAAGSVVSNDVEPWSIVGGVPAKFIKKRSVQY